MKKINEINGQLLQAILRGATVFDFKCTETHAYVMIEQKNGFFLPKGDIFYRYPYVLYVSDNNKPFVLHNGYKEPAEMMKEFFSVWDTKRKSEQRKKKHFK